MIAKTTITLSLLVFMLSSCAGNNDSPPATRDKQVVSGAESAQAPEGGSDSCRSETRRAEALRSGRKLLGGVTLKEAVPIAKINAATEGFDGETVQVEGTIVSLCPSAGCWALITDGSGNNIRLKVTDGIIDFRDQVKPGQYVVADGVYTPTGHHGAQVFIQKHGAMVTDSVCP